jgi:hypothetical protein
LCCPSVDGCGSPCKPSCMETLPSGLIGGRWSINDRGCYNSATPGKHQHLGHSCPSAHGFISSCKSFISFKVQYSVLPPSQNIRNRGFFRTNYGCIRNHFLVAILKTQGLFTLITSFRVTPHILYKKGQFYLIGQCTKSSSPP